MNSQNNQLSTSDKITGGILANGLLLFVLFLALSFMFEMSSLWYIVPLGVALTSFFIGIVINAVKFYRRK